MVEALIRAHINAKAEHDRLFALNDQGLASDEEVADALDPLDAALIAICAARPANLEEGKWRRSYLSANLYEAIDGCVGLTKAVCEALIAGEES